MLKIAEIVQTLKGIIETKLNMVKRDIQEEFVGILARVIFLILMGGSLFLVLLFMSLSLAFYISQYFEAPYMGFFMVGLLYLLILLILILSRDSSTAQSKIQGALRVFIFKKSFFKKDEE